jgi:hypothetical protein
VAERPKGPQNVNLAALVDPNIAFDFKTAESPEERASRLRREEAEEITGSDMVLGFSPLR